MHLALEQQSRISQARIPDCCVFQCQVKKRSSKFSAVAVMVKVAGWETTKMAPISQCYSFCDSGAVVLLCCYLRNRNDCLKGMAVAKQNRVSLLQITSLTRVVFIEII
mmetsp:Transcript_22913/g.63775  ORF Transcript_22913/g.63775 Transcript_22913/m.63775 type:complete len:108 (+) Transcript_22913:1122-1445(+)